LRFRQLSGHDRAMNRAPAAPRARAINLPAVVLWLAAAFIGVHVVRTFLSEANDEWVLGAFAFIPSRYGAPAGYYPGGVGAEIWTPITHAFLHADYVHLFVNIIWMASFGGALARRFGATRFLVLSLLSAVAGAAVFYAVHPGEEVLVVGASGAVSGMMAGTARFAFSPGGPLAGGRSFAAFNVPAEPLLAVFRNGRAVAFILIWFLVNLVFGFAGGSVAGIPGPIAWEAHIGGFLAGLLSFSPLDPVGRPDDEGLAS
jgi:membrane associated rhomboid family serine protease